MRAADHLELELHTVMSLRVSAENGTAELSHLSSRDAYTCVFRPCACCLERTLPLELE